jgi:dTDP-4-amino-4,6-dideoxygalactose transaminase
MAARYEALLAGSGVEPPYVPADREANYQSYIVRLRGRGRTGRDRILDRLLERGVHTRPGVMTAHREPPYRSGGWKLPVTETVSDETLVLPLYHQLTEAQQDRVVEELRAAL